MRLLKKIINWIDRVRNRFPKENLRRKFVYISLVTTLVPLVFLVFMIHGTYTILDLIFSFRNDISVVIQASFFLTYVGVGVFTILEIKEWWDLLDMIYEPIKTLEERTVEKIIDPFRSYLMKMDLTIGGLMILIYILIIISSMLFGFSWLFLIPLILVSILGLIMISISVLIYILIKSMVLFFIGFIWNKIDSRFRIIEKFKMNWDRIKTLEDNDDDYVDI